MKAIDYAKYFVSQKIGADEDSFEGNMKLQKLLFFADMINLAKHDTPLFDDKIYAFKKGCVIEDVRLYYKLQYDELMADSFNRCPKYSESDEETLKITVDIFGRLSAEELSELNHEFDFWKTMYAKRYDTSPKSTSIVTVDMMRKELDRVKDMLDAYDESKESSTNCITINNVNFFYDDDVVLTEELKQELAEYSINAEDNSYSFYFDEDVLVVY